jgi:molybdenum cofactor synthesis domain-containing protein
MTHTHGAPKHPPRYAVLTLSDRASRGEATDASGPLAAELLAGALGTEALSVEVLADDQASIERRLIALADAARCDLVVTTGGTGLSPRDVTPEATRAVIDREIPGIAEAIRAGGLAKTPLAMLSRAVCGQRGRCLILNLSGSPKAVREQLAVVLPVLAHALRVAAETPESPAVTAR